MKLLTYDGRRTTEPAYTISSPGAFGSDELKILDDTWFCIPFITTEQVESFIRNLDSSNATGVDGIAPRIIKLAVHCLSPTIAMLIINSLVTGQFPSQLKLAKVCPIYKSGA